MRRKKVINCTPTEVCVESKETMKTHQPPKEGNLESYCFHLSRGAHTFIKQNTKKQHYFHWPLVSGGSFHSPLHYPAVEQFLSDFAAWFHFASTHFELPARSASAPVETPMQMYTHATQVSSKACSATASPYEEETFNNGSQNTSSYFRFWDVHPFITRCGGRWHGG